MKRVFLYIRVSTEEQAIHGLSIEAQTAALEEWARSNRHKAVGTYVDAGISARKPASKRPKSQTLFEGHDELKRKIDTLATKEQVKELADDVDIIKAVVS